MQQTSVFPRKLGRHILSDLMEKPEPAQPQGHPGALELGQSLAVWLGASLSLRARAIGVTERDKCSRGWHKGSACSEGPRAQQTLECALLYKHLLGSEPTVPSATGAVTASPEDEISGGRESEPGTEQENPPAVRQYFGDFPGGPVAKTLHSPCSGPRFDPYSG